MLNEKKVVPKLRQEVKVKIDIVTIDDIKIYYTGKLQNITARYILYEAINLSCYRYVATVKGDRDKERPKDYQVWSRTQAISYPAKLLS